MKFFKSKLLAVLVLISFSSSCAVKSHQFAHAVHKGNVQSAQSFYEPGFANMKFSLTSAPGKYSLPIQYAILQKNKPMAKFLLDNGSPKRLNGQNLAYYCSYNSKSEMARYFASIGEGSYSDIGKARRDLAEHKRQNRIAANRTALVGLAILGAIMSNGFSSGGQSGDGRCINCGSLDAHGDGMCSSCKAINAGLR